MSTPTATVWEVPRESKEWCGPITVTATVDGVKTVIDPGNLKFALLPLGQRPTDADWTAAVPEPGGDPANAGIQLSPTVGPMILAIWAQITDNPNVPVIEPGGIGRVVRT